MQLSAGSVVLTLGRRTQVEWRELPLHHLLKDLRTAHVAAVGGHHKERLDIANTRDDAAYLNQMANVGAANLSNSARLCHGTRTKTHRATECICCLLVGSKDIVDGTGDPLTIDESAVAETEPARLRLP